MEKINHGVHRGHGERKGNEERKMNETEITGKIIGAAMAVHKALGPGLLEDVYKNCLFYKLQKSGLLVVKEKPMPVVFEEIVLDCGYRLDLLVEDSVVVELKSIKKIEDVHLAQILTYLRLGKYKYGLLLNFNVKMLKDGIKRLVN
jgi:GxxExxY protein